MTMPRRKSTRRAVRLLLWAAALLPVVLPVRTARAGGALTRRTLANGLTMIHERDTASPLTVLNLVIKGGQRDEPEGRAGLSYLVTRLMLEIQDAPSAQALMRQASSCGMAALGDLGLISVESLSEHFENTLRIVSPSVFDPLISGVRLDRIKDGMDHQRLLLEDDAIQLAHLAQLRAAFGGSAYGPSVLGDEGSLKAIGRKHVSEFYRAHLTTDGVALVVISDLAEDAVAAVIEKAWPAFPSGPAHPPRPLKPFPEVRERTFLAKQTKQSLVSCGFRLPGLTARSYALASMVENVLGKGPGSRLWPLRQAEKLAYNVSAEATLFRDGGLLETYLETDCAQAGLAASRLRQVLAELREGGVDAEELETAKAVTKANALRDNETKDRRCSNRAYWEAMGLGADFLERLAAEVDAVSIEEFDAYLKACLDTGRMSLVIVGPDDIADPDPGPAKRN